MEHLTLLQLKLRDMVTEEKKCLRILQFLQVVRLYLKNLDLHLPRLKSKILVEQNLLRLQKKILLSSTDLVILQKSRAELVRLKPRLKKLHLNLIKKNFRKDLLNLQVV